MTQTPTEQLIRTAIRLSDPSAGDGAVLAEALHNAGVLSVPTDAGELRRFAIGPLRWAVIAAAGPEVADRVLASLARHFGWRTTTVGMKAVRAISSRPCGRLSVPPLGTRPSSLRPRAAVTLSYLEMGRTGRPLDVLVLDADKSRAMPIVDALAANAILVAHVAEVEVAREIAEGVGPSLLLVHPTTSDAEGLRMLTAALRSSGARGAAVRAYAEAGTTAAALAVGATVLRYTSIAALVARIVNLVGERGEAAS